MRFVKFNLKYIYLFLLLAFSLTSHIQAQPTFQSSETAIGKTSNVTVSKPAGTAQYDLLIIGLMYEKGADENITPPTGWNLIRTTNNVSDCGMATYYKVAGLVEPATYTFNLNRGSKWAIGITRITNFSLVDPIDASTIATGSGKTVNAPSVTTSGNDRLVLAFYTNKKGAIFPATASGTIKQYDRPNSVEGLPSNMVASFVQTSAGATDTKSATARDDERWAAQQIAINPASYQPLPIRLIRFDAKLDNSSTVQLAWQTASETDNDYFTIERSNDFIKWESLTKVQGAGTSSIVKHYAAHDPAPNTGVNYYRLKQTDFDGTFVLSKILAVNLKSLPNVKIYPNPTLSKILIDGCGDPSQIRVFDLTGRALLVPVSAETERSVKLDLSNLNQGVYLVKTNTGTYKVIKE